MCTACVPVTGAGIIVMADAGPGAMLASTDGPARILEELQFTLGEGPCVDASTSRPAGAAARAGQNRPSALAGLRRGRAGRRGPGDLRVPAAGRRHPGRGAGPLSGRRRSLWTTAELAEALAFADAATVRAAACCRPGPGATGEHPGSGRLIEDRAEVHQATGMISVQAGLGLAAALVLLRAHSYAAERPILDVAREVIARTLRFDPEDDHHE